MGFFFPGFLERVRRRRRFFARGQLAGRLPVIMSKAGRVAVRPRPEMLEPALTGPSRRSVSRPAPVFERRS